MALSTAGSLAGEARSVTGVREPDSASGTVSDRLEQLTAAVAESVHLQAQLNERFAVRLLEFGSSVGAIEMICRRIDGRIEELTAARVERTPHVRGRTFPLGIRAAAVRGGVSGAGAD